MSKRALDIEVFNDDEPYCLQERFSQAADELDMKIVGDSYIEMNRKQADELAKRVMDLAEESTGTYGPTFDFTGEVLWKMCPYVKSVSDGND